MEGIWGTHYQNVRASAARAVLQQLYKEELAHVLEHGPTRRLELEHPASSSVATETTTLQPVRQRSGQESTQTSGDCPLPQASLDALSKAMEQFYRLVQ
jgi:hypothetical protein